MQQQQNHHHPRSSMYEQLSAAYGTENKGHYKRLRTSIKDPSPSANERGEDGEDHINIWESAKTDLGRALSHGSRIPLKHSIFGRFQSMESFWYYMQSAERDDRIRNMSDQTLRNFSRKMTPVRVVNFRAIIMDSNYQRIKAHHALATDMAKSTMPFECYFTQRDSSVRIRPNYFKWLIDGFTEIRSALRDEREPDFRFLMDREAKNGGIYDYAVPTAPQPTRERRTPATPSIYQEENSKPAQAKKPQVLAEADSEEASA